MLQNAHLSLLKTHLFEDQVPRKFSIKSCTFWRPIPNKTWQNAWSSRGNRLHSKFYASQGRFVSARFSRVHQIVHSTTNFWKKDTMLDIDFLKLQPIPASVSLKWIPPCEIYDLRVQKNTNFSPKNLSSHFRQHFFRCKLVTVFKFFSGMFLPRFMLLLSFAHYNEEVPKKTFLINIFSSSIQHSPPIFRQWKWEWMERWACSHSL
jgi:hypothetical protein